MIWIFGSILLVTFSIFIWLFRGLGWRKADGDKEGFSNQRSLALLLVVLTMLLSWGLIWEDYVRGDLLLLNDLRSGKIYRVEMIVKDLSQNPPKFIVRLEGGKYAEMDKNPSGIFKVEGNQLVPLEGYHVAEVVYSATKTKEKETGSKKKN